MKIPTYGQGHQGVLVFGEGPEGAGKTTAFLKAVEQLQLEGYLAFYYKEPGDATEFGKAIRGILFDAEKRFGELSPMVELCLLLATRAEQTEKLIAPHLDRGEIVLLDRSYPSSYAYQVGEDPRLSRFVDEGHRLILSHQCDLIIIFDVDDEVSIARQKDRGTTNRIEEKGDGYHTRVNQRYREMARDNRYPVINGNLSREEVLGQVLSCVRPLLSQ